MLYMRCMGLRMRMHRLLGLLCGRWLLYGLLGLMCIVCVRWLLCCGLRLDRGFFGG